MSASTLTAPMTGFERVASGLLVASLGLVMLNLFTGQLLFGIAAIMWLRIVMTDRAPQPLPAFFWWLAAYGALTILSAIFSTDPATSLPDLKQLLLFLMVPMIMRLARGDRAMVALDVIIAIGAVGAVVGVIEAAAFRGIGDLSNRPQGSLTHYMTYSGVIMLVLCAVVARLLFHRRQWIWPAVAVPALAVALAVTMTRNAWIGAIVGIGAILAVRQLRLLLLVPVFVGLFFLVAPASLEQRAFSVIDLQDPSNRDRLTMLQIGAEMIRDRPLVGVGPDMVLGRYPEYRPADAVNPVNVHLHNVPMQIAAERGLPALAVWLGFVVVAALGLIRHLRTGPERALAGAGLAALTAMLAAGLFEYNFGDSEFLMLLLGLLTLPHAARLPTRSATGVPVAHDASAAAPEAARPRPA